MSASELAALLQLDRHRRLPGKEGAGGAQRRDSAASTDRGRHQLDCIGNVRRLRGGARYGAGAPLPSDLGGYRFSGFGRGLAADAGTPAPVVDGVSLAQPLRWQGRWLDSATGIYDVRNRQWAPELGAFLSADDFRFHGPRGTFWSWPRQNPVRYRDWTGRVGDETIIQMDHPESKPAGLPPGPPSGIFVGVSGGATFTGAVSAGAGEFFGAATPDATYSSLGIGVGFLPAAGAGVQVGWFAGTADEFGQAQTLFLGVGSGVGVEGALLFGPNGSFGAASPRSSSGDLRFGAGPSLRGRER